MHPSSSAERAGPWAVPTRAAAAGYWRRVWRQALLRSARNLVGQPVRRHRSLSEGSEAPILAEVSSPLWDDDASDKFMLVAGKVHNLRIAARGFHGVVVPPGETLRFWKRVGRPNALRGFVQAREICEGCVVPTIAGSLCQLSNTLAIAPDAAGLELVERRRHTARPIGHATEQGRAIDATVFWKFEDQGHASLRIEVELDSAQLCVRIRRAGVAHERAAQTFAAP